MNLTDKSILNIWGGGQLLAFSGFDGDTDCEKELLLRSVTDIAAFEVKLPQTGGLLVADLAPPTACFIAGDHFELELRSGEKVRGAFLDAYHVLILGKVSVSGLSDAVRIKRRHGRMLLGVSSNFNETLISADFEEAWCARRKWLENAQRPSGQLPSIIPSAGWNYTAGPAWDSALFVIPYNIYLFTGDRDCIEKNYDLMRSYLSFCAEMSEDNTVDFGLGDWSPPEWDKMAPAGLTSTGCYYGCVEMFSKFAGLLGREDDRISYSKLASDIKAAFNKKYYKGGGVFANGEMTSIAAALYWGLCEDSEKKSAVAKLVSLVVANSCKSDFGILGAKYVPRVLADNGHADLAFRMITQEEYPGWGYWIKKGATTLWEHWTGTSSKNHIMFGDISAWMYQYPGGFSHDFDNPGEKYMKIAPKFIAGLEHVRAEHQGYVSEWKVEGGVFRLSVTVPEGGCAFVSFPDGSKHEVKVGSHQFESEQKDKALISMHI